MLVTVRDGTGSPALLLAARLEIVPEGCLCHGRIQVSFGLSDLPHNAAYRVEEEGFLHVDLH